MKLPQTKFGAEVRQLRQRRLITQSEMAKRLGVSAAFLSSIEIGTKSTPDDFLVRVDTALSLLPSEREKLVLALASETNKIDIVHLDKIRRELLINLSTSAPFMTQEEISEISKNAKNASQRAWIYKKAQQHRRGFDQREYGSHHARCVRPRSDLEIHNIAERVRGLFCPDTQFKCPIVHVLEFELHKVAPDFHIAIATLEELGTIEATTEHVNRLIWFREDVYEKLVSDNEHARFTACHELGHVILHPPEKGKLYVKHRPKDGRQTNSERQANKFAGAFLMSRANYRALDSIDLASRVCCMSKAAATIQFDDYSYLRPTIRQFTFL
jgi:transcriptional regulator with XRE-family HTH domain